MAKNFLKGFTLVEILVAIGIIVLLLAIVLPRFYDFRENQVVSSSASDTISAIDKARSQTLGSLNDSEYGVHFESGRVVIFKGTSYSAWASDNENIDILSPAKISNVTLGGISAASGEFYFARLTGAPSKTGTLTISSPKFSRTITITATGSAN